MSDLDGPGRYQYMSFNAPLSETHADEIAARLAYARPADVLDIGCGWGELMLRVLDRAPEATGLGVDTDDDLLGRGRAAAEQRGLSERAVFANTAGAAVDQQADLVICVGASHAFGGNAAALASLMRHVRPGGRLFYGDGLWDPSFQPPRPELVWADFFELPDIARLVDLAVATGYLPLYTETASPAELDDFESRYLADDEEWLLRRPRHPRAPEVRAAAEDHRRRWLHGYRGGFGFAYLTLGRPAE
ncbi:MAG: class I SAM-dependent methyltransferase [Hamadaea sp.]|uniref:SAM-dependent methyltransferase n=1 Tax=Hamadaea sp. TaxID=2024425 RepID=UPI0017D15A97|nr:class I SAM-dependent methyltransferase [Hamadaea sp.]NUR69962.1 class I SAM-dependent methyltransferase [Hamadaea sp.]NUT20656.1 class I SAM-dependent methyltransferase [Hamadaea sp.]